MLFLRILFHLLAVGPGPTATQARSLSGPVSARWTIIRNLLLLGALHGLSRVISPLNGGDETAPAFPLPYFSDGKKRESTSFLKMPI
jgi:hypothetical protein